MHALANNVLGRLKYDITGAGLAIVVEPLAGTPFSLPPAPTNAATPTYGAPYGIFAIADRLDLSQAKFELVIYTARAAELGGAFTYTVPADGRGWEGSAAQAWVAGAYVVQVPTADVLAMHTSRAVLRGGLSIAHARDAAMTWDGANFKFSWFRVLSVGRGKHFSTGGYFDIQMPANGTTVKGFGGAADTAVAAGAIPLLEGQALWYEAPIGQGVASVAANFRVTGIGADFQVPAHWVFLAVHQAVAVNGEKQLRVSTGATLVPWREIGAAGEPAFQNAWANLGATEKAAFRKDQHGRVFLRGLISGGAMGAAVAFTLPAGYRPGNMVIFSVSSAVMPAEMRVLTTGAVTMNVGSNVYMCLDQAQFLAEL